jgi:hypothetical protein
MQRAFELVKEVVAQARLPLYHCAPASNSWSASGWLTTCMELGANVPNGFFRRTASDLAFFDLAGPSVNDFLPSRFSVSVHGVVETGDESMGQIGPVLFWQSQRLGNFFSHSAHAGTISLRPTD